MRFHRLTLILATLVATLPLMGTQCTASSFCDKALNCQKEEHDRDFSDDAVAVCAVEYETGINALLANEEEECQRLAQAQIALDNCRIGLKCDDFVEADLGGECDDQLDELEDARDDVDDNECSAQEGD
jgi:hypothetical protein